MRIAFCADVHLGNHRRMGGPVVAGVNSRGRLALETFESAVQRSVSLGCKALVVLGDLLDTSSPEPQLLAEIQEIVKDAPVIIVMGNHEQVSSAAGDHALGPLVPVADVIEKPQIVDFGHVELWVVPFSPGRATDWLPSVMAEMQGSASVGRQPRPVRVLALHLGLSDGKTPPWLIDAHDSVSVELVQKLCAQYSIDHVFAGNWHNRNQWPGILQVGTLCPTGWDNPGLDGYGGLAVLTVGDDRVFGQLEIQEIPGPRFLKITEPLSDANLQNLKDAGHSIFVRNIAPPEFLDIAKEWLERVKAEGLIAGGEVEPEGTEERVAAITAAHSAKSATTLDEAVASFVRDMALPDDVDRGAVLARVKSYLGGAS